MLSFVALDLASAAATSSSGSTCYDIKKAYQDSTCCNSNLAQTTDFDIGPAFHKKDVLKAMGAANPCAGKKPTGPTWDNKNCTVNGIIDALEQSGTNVTKGYVGGMNVNNTGPIITDYLAAGLCPVNVHWHLGAEHYSVGQYDEFGSSPTYTTASHGYGRRMGTNARQGFQCHHYDSSDTRFTVDYDWKYCTNTHVGETYEVHWPHSAAGMCGTPNQYQTPFYDGVFCNDAAVGMVLSGDIAAQNAIGVQGQVFTIINDENYYYPDLMRGMIIDGAYGADITKYTGSTTGTTRNNEICSQYAPITWQVDRNCHLISASSFDKMCKDMLSQKDDMSGDVHPHGARELVAHELAADNHKHRE